MGDVSFNTSYPKFTHHISTQDALLPLYIVKSPLDHDINTWGLIKDNIINILQPVYEFSLKKVVFFCLTKIWSWAQTGS